MPSPGDLNRLTRDGITVQPTKFAIQPKAFQQLITTDTATSMRSFEESAARRKFSLDVTMPDIDGLEFCRTVRSIGKFKNLPIIMLTARDKLSDKYRGQIAGATHYLTKPVEPIQLLQIVDKCVNPSNIISFA